LATFASEAALSTTYLKKQMSQSYEKRYQ